MSMQDENLLARLRSAFYVEAIEHLQAMDAALLELEKSEDPHRRREVIASAYREAHSLKGAAHAVNLAEIEAVSQSLEEIFAICKRRNARPASDLFDPLHRIIDAISARIPSRGHDVLESIEETARLVEELATIQRAMESAEAGTVSEGKHPDPPPRLQAEPPARREPTAAAETLRVSTAKLDDLLLRAEELLTIRLGAGQRLSHLRKTRSKFSQWEKEWSRLASSRCEIRKMLDGAAANSRTACSAPAETAAIARLQDFLTWNELFVQELRAELSEALKAAEHDARSTASLVDGFLEDSKKLLMQPFSRLLEICPRLVRDLAHSQAKEVELELHDVEIEIDKRILDAIKEPLIHLIRNAVDHGIEPPADRSRLGKQPRAKLSISVAQLEANRVELILSDDGAGIDPEHIRSAALRNAPDDADAIATMCDADALQLIFRADVSTSQDVTRVSGRGLGLTIAKEAIERLGGRISVETQPGRGTLFRMQLPVTFATYRAIIVEAAGQRFALPTAGVQRAVRIDGRQVRTISHRETIQHEQRPLSHVRLEDLLGLAPVERPKIAQQSALILTADERRIACTVDAVLDEREIIVKQLGRPLQQIPIITGMTVLASGKPIPILNVAELIRSAKKCGSPVRTESRPDSQQSRRRKSLLVVDDSITTRMLLKNILEAAGYTVRTAVDGVDAMLAIQSERPDGIVSDIQMPRMDGFELVSKVRADEKLAELPVVLVTALASQEDRARGISVGADAYLVKSSFDQSDLLRTLRRLL